jgi:hypothetical protein
MKKYALLLLLLFAGNFVLAQEEVPDIITDRPDQTESTAIVPLNMLQIETGFVSEQDETKIAEISGTTYNGTLLRYGLFKRAELRVGMDYLKESVRMKRTGQTMESSGFSPLYTGLKVKMTEGKGLLPDMALLGSLTWPGAASDDLQTPYMAPALRLVFAHILSETLSLGYNLGAEWNGISPAVSYYYSLALGMGLTEKIGAFLESYGSVYKKAKPEHKADAGFTWLLRENLQLDVSGGIGLSKIAPDHFVSFGLSWRIPE